MARRGPCGGCARPSGAGALRRRPDGKSNDRAGAVLDRRAPEPCAGAPTANPVTVRKRIGVMVPSTNTTCEADFNMVVPRGVTVHGQRLSMTNDANGDAAYQRMNGEIEMGARYLATARVDAIAY